MISLEPRKMVAFVQCSIALDQEYMLLHSAAAQTFTPLTSQCLVWIRRFIQHTETIFYHKEVSNNLYSVRTNTSNQVRWSVNRCCLSQSHNLLTCVMTPTPPSLPSLALSLTVISMLISPPNS